MDYKIKLPENYIKPAMAGRDLWIQALRSGNYEQGIDYLKKGNRFCCLGVLQELHGLPISPHAGLLSERDPLYCLLQGHGEWPTGVLVRTSSGALLPSLTMCNDLGMTFDQIADIIERVWENA